MAKINWYKEKAMLAMKDPGRKLLLAYGFQVEANAKVNITDNDQIDTGFMRNSVYVTGAGESTYNNADASGTYTGKAGDTVQRNIAPEETPGRDSVYVTVGAEYAIYQEMQESFLYKALEQTVGVVPGASIVRTER